MVELEGEFICLAGYLGAYTKVFTLRQCLFVLIAK